MQQAIVTHMTTEHNLTSPLCMQLYGLLSSMLKLAVTPGNKVDLALPLDSRLALFDATQEQHATLLQAYQSAVCHTTCSVLQSYTGHSASTAAPAAIPNTAGLGSLDAEAMLPWLALLGRVMLQCGAGLHDLYSSFQQTQQAKPSSRSRGGAKARPAGSYWLLLGCARSDADQEAERYCQQVGFELWEHLQWACPVGLRCVETAAQCLLGEGAATVLQQLAALGYDMQPLLPLWDTFKRDPQVTDFLGGFTRHVSGTQGAGSGHLGFSVSYLHNKTAVSSLRKLLQGVHALGTALTAFAQPHCCNNPMCGNVLRSSDAALVGGRSCMCAGCPTARCCSGSCQKLHWKQQHKPVCKAVAAAAAGAPPGSS